MKTYVRAETVPLHANMTQLSKDFHMVAVGAVDHDERIEKLEAEIKLLREQLADALAKKKSTRRTRTTQDLQRLLSWVVLPASRELCIRKMRKHAEAKIPRDSQG